MVCQPSTKVELRLTEMAVDLGFSDANNFIRAFKGLKGVTPGAYRSSCAESSTASREAWAGDQISPGAIR